MSDGAISSYHTGGANTAMLDGSVRYLSKQMDPKVLKSMLEGVHSDEVGAVTSDE